MLNGRWPVASHLLVYLSNLYPVMETLDRTRIQLSHYAALFMFSRTPVSRYPTVVLFFMDPLPRPELVVALSGFAWVRHARYPVLQ